jgi:D-xylose 1-dehydrogenase (NADP+, D-xylono-1,5-lactone-forming)
MSPRPVASLRWGILGTASIARALIPAIRASGCGTVAAVASRDPARAAAFAAEHSIPLACGYGDFLERGVVDVVYNPLPNHLHATWTTRCLEAGLPVLCEKPFALDAAEARAVAAVARRTGVPVAEAFMYRFHPLYDRLRELLDTGAIGEIVSVASCFTFFLDDRTALPARAELGGGALMDVGCYCVELARRIARREPVCAHAAARLGDVDETLVGVLEFPGGVLASLECSIAAFERHAATIAGTRGAIVIRAPWFPGVDAGELRLQLEGREEVIATAGGDGYVLEVQDFARACATGAAPRWPVEDAVANMAALDALRAAARTGTPIAVAATP